MRDRRTTPRLASFIEVDGPVALQHGNHSLRIVRGAKVLRRGVLRVESAEGRYRLSGDLYSDFTGSDDEDVVFPRRCYSAHVKLIAARSEAGALELRLLHHERGEDGRWLEPEPWTLALERLEEGRLSGKAFDQWGLELGDVHVRHRTRWLRNAVVELDRSTHAEVPEGLPDRIESIFDHVGWKVELRMPGSEPCEEPPGGWTFDRLHVAMIELRDRAARLDEGWHYHVLCVGKISKGDSDQILGYMYDGGMSFDSKDVAREGVAVVMPSDGSPSRQMRTVAHELGHAMGLIGHVRDGSVMTQTKWLPPGDFSWEFSDDHSLWLKHAPDPLVRPGGSRTPPTPIPTRKQLYKLQAGKPDLELRVRPILPTFPLGAPIRLELVVSGREEEVVAKFMKTVGFRFGGISGAVYPPLGEPMRISPLFLTCDDEKEGGSKVESPKGDTAALPRQTYSIALLGGEDGPLFPTPGTYAVFVNLESRQRELMAHAMVHVSRPRSPWQERAAHAILSSRRFFLGFVLGNAVMQLSEDELKAIKRDHELHRHYRIVFAKQRIKDATDDDAVLAAADEVVQFATYAGITEYESVLRRLESIDDDVARRIGGDIRRRIDDWWTWWK